MPRPSGYASGTAEEGVLFIKLKEYLDRLDTQERQKPVEQRRRVPTMEELAQVVGVHPVTLSNIANSNIKQLNLETGGRIITAMRRFGFAMTIDDLIGYREPEASGEHKNT